MDKLNEYYEKTADSDAHILAMCMFLWVLFLFLLISWPVVLHPVRKMVHFKKHWDTALQKEVSELGRNAVCHD